MLSEKRNQQHVSIIELSKQMLDACEQEQWESLAGLEAERRKLIEAFFDPAPEAQEAEAVTRAVHQIQALEKELIKRCTDARQVCLQQLNNIDAGKRASAAYGDNVK